MSRDHGREGFCIQGPRHQVFWFHDTRIVLSCLAGINTRPVQFHFDMVPVAALVDLSEAASLKKWSSGDFHGGKVVSWIPGDMYIRMIMLVSPRQTRSTCFLLNKERHNL